MCIYIWKCVKYKNWENYIQQLFLFFLLLKIVKISDFYPRKMSLNAVKGALSAVFDDFHPHLAIWIVKYFQQPTLFFEGLCKKISYLKFTNVWLPTLLVGPFPSFLINFQLKFKLLNTTKQQVSWNLPTFNLDDAKVRSYFQTTSKKHHQTH